jgi:hypothetical protein
LQLFGGGAGRLAMVLGVGLGGFNSVISGVMMVAVSHVRVMTGHVVVTGFVVARRFAMMPRGVLVVFSCFVMMLGCFSGHLFFLRMRLLRLGGRHKAEPVKLRPC